MFLHCAIAMQVWITLMLLYFVHVQVNAFVTVPCSWNNFNIPAMSSACFFDEITFGSFKSIGYKSLIGIMCQSLLELRLSKHGSYHRALMTMWAIIQTKSVPNLSNFVPYEGQMPKFLPHREESMLQVQPTTIWLLALRNVYVHISFQRHKGLHISERIEHW